MAKFSIYLGANSVTAYNDGVVEHLKYLLENAKSNGDTAQYGDYSAQKQAHEALIEKRRGEIEKNENQVPANQDIVQQRVSRSCPCMVRPLRHCSSERMHRFPSRMLFRSRYLKVAVGRDWGSG
jgi:hypothetical protein